MPRFPQEEAKIIELAQKVANGIAENITTFPNPPVSPNSLNANIDAYVAKLNEIQLSRAATTHLIQEKDEILGHVSDATRDNIDYGILIAKGDEAILQMISWSNRAHPTALEPPGQCRALEILDQGSGWVKIDWKEPATGGKISAYKVQRSDDGINFLDVATAVESEAMLMNQPTGKSLIYRAVAINKAGEGMPSNTVSLVL